MSKPNTTLRAIVIGAGYAAEGHTIGLREAGVEIVALCGRTPEPAYKRATQLNVPNVRFDWRAALEEFRPDIVSITTPAGPHREMAVFAAQLGCQVVCEKPLATNTADAKAMLEAVERAGVRHGYAATHRYTATILYARTLIAQGLIGHVFEIESVLHVGLPRSLPFCWVHELEQGGGLLNNIFTHKLAQVLHATRGIVRAATGESRSVIDRAPVGPPIHDFRDWFGSIGTWNSAQASEWRSSDADLAYTVTVRIMQPDGTVANALFHGSALGITPQPEYLVFHGDAGSLYMSGDWSNDHIHCFVSERGTWEEMLIPPEVTAALPPTQDHVQRYWNQFLREFVADVNGEGYAGYPTFRDGCTAVEIMDIARAGSDWTAL